MKTCIFSDLKYILLDQTESDVLYLTFLELFKKKHLSNCEDPTIIEAFDELANEIKNPTKIDEKKYKIPHKYIIQDLLLAEKQNHDLYQITSTLINFKKYNGFFDLSYGKKLEELFSDPNNYLYLHNIVYRGQKLPPKQITEITNSICKNGLRLPDMGNEVGKIEYTTLNTHTSTNRSFFTYLPYWELGDAIVILQIPKKLIDNNQPVLGCNSEELSNNDPGHVLPQYVVGFLSKLQFHQNQVNEKDQTKYPYTLPEVVCVKNDGYSL